MPTVQTDYDIVPKYPAYRGTIARPEVKPWFEEYILSGGTQVQPGDLVMTTGASGSYTVVAATGATNSPRAVGIVCHEVSDVQGSTALAVRYSAGASIKVLIQGVVWCEAGGAIGLGDEVNFVPASHDWTARGGNPSFTVATMPSRRFISMGGEDGDLNVSDGELFMCYVSGFLG